MPSVLLVGGVTPTNVALVGAFRSLGLDAQLIAPSKIRSQPRRDVIHLGRLDVLASLQGIEDGLEELRTLELEGACVLNSATSLLLCHDKLATARVLRRAGLPHPRTTLVDAEGTPKQLEPPVVVKPRFGSWGRNIHLCATEQELEETIQKLRKQTWFQTQGALIQELEPTAGQDIRVIVANGHIVGAVRRIARAGDWATSSLGGTRRPVRPSKEIVSTAVQAAAAVEADLVGVDVAATHNRLTVIDVNGCADFTSEYGSGNDVFVSAASGLLEAASRRLSMIPRRRASD
jgi:[lysine-biosynthesis-protein LysW]--L-2-aminoadipate ligase